MKIPIIKEEKDYLIINKPAGLIVHGGPHIHEKTLVDYLLEKYPDLRKIGEDPFRPAIVHRLDKDASGLMVIPKNNEFFHYLKKQFKERKIKKEYSALVYGVIEKDYGTIDFPIKRSSQGHKMAAIPKKNKNIDKKENVSNRQQGNIDSQEKSREALTNFLVVRRYSNFTLLNVDIKTGRTHQIRVHFSAYGYPLWGDNLYANKKSKVKNKKMNTERLFLTATCLGFFSPEKVWQEFEIDPGPDLKKILSDLK